MRRKIMAKAAVITILFTVTNQAIASCNRYKGWIDNGDGTAFDPRTNITWQYCRSSKVNSNLCAEDREYKSMGYSEAMTLAKNDRFLGKDDWRLPTISELYKSADEQGCWEEGGVFSPLFRLKTHLRVSASPDVNTYSSSNLNLGSVSMNAYNGSSLSDSSARHIVNTWHAVLLVRSDDNSAKNQFNEAYNNTIRLVEDLRNKAAREAQAAAAAERSEAAADRAYADRTRIFRSKVQAGDETTDGIVTEVKGNLVKIQTSESQCTQRDYDRSCRNYVDTIVEKWFKRSQIFPRR